MSGEEKAFIGSNSEDITFNVIYVQNTVELVLPFLSSLLHHDTCRFRLVANGCSRHEEQLLKDFTDKHDRLSFYSLGSNKVTLHHDALLHLLEMETSPYFAILDSDMLATDHYLDQILEALNEKQAVFTGLPLWHEAYELKMPKHFQMLGGRFVKSHNDFLFGLTYGAIYRTSELRSFIQSSGIDFRRYYWHELPQKYQEALQSLDLHKHYYDTAKALNILWQHYGAKMDFVEVDSLIHLGGVSGPTNRNGFILSMRIKMMNAYIGFKQLMKKMLGIRDFMTKEERKDIRKLVKKRRCSANFANHLLKEPESDMPVSNEFEGRLKRQIEQSFDAIRQEIQKPGSVKANIHSVRTD